jgi:hypothetical protein
VAVLAKAGTGAEAGEQQPVYPPPPLAHVLPAWQHMDSGIGDTACSTCLHLLLEVLLSVAACVPECCKEEAPAGTQDIATRTTGSVLLL